jgi:anti-sigma regulatory factor (Ser/Thr protein kinase)
MLSLTLELERDRDAPARARTMVRGLRLLLGPERTEDATLLVSELVTNAVKYGPDEQIRVIVDDEGERTRFTVHDAGLGPLPEIRDEDPAHGGHGLRLVDAVADRWGVERGSTRVWFELRH